MLATKAERCDLCHAPRDLDPQRGGCRCLSAADSFMRDVPDAPWLDNWYRREAMLGIAAALAAKREELRFRRRLAWWGVGMAALVALYFWL